MKKILAFILFFMGLLALGFLPCFWGGAILWSLLPDIFCSGDCFAFGLHGMIFTYFIWGLFSIFLSVKAAQNVCSDDTIEISSGDGNNIKNENNKK